MGVSSSEASFETKWEVPAVSSTSPPAVAPEASNVPVLAMPSAALRLIRPPWPSLASATTDPDCSMVDSASISTLPPAVLPPASSVPVLLMSPAPVNRMTPPSAVMELASTAPALLITAPCSLLAASAVISTRPSWACTSCLFSISVLTVAGSTLMFISLPSPNSSLAPSPAASATVPPPLACSVPSLRTVAATKAM